MCACLCCLPWAPSPPGLHAHAFHCLRALLSPAAGQLRITVDEDSIRHQERRLAAGRLSQHIQGIKAGFEAGRCVARHRADARPRGGLVRRDPAGWVGAAAAHRVALRACPYGPLRGGPGQGADQAHA